MGVAKDIHGEVFGRLTVVKRNGSRYKVPLWECKGGIIECAERLN